MRFCEWCQGAIDPDSDEGKFCRGCVAKISEGVLPQRRLDRVAIVRLAKQRHQNIRRLLKNQDPRIVEVGEYMQARIEAALA